MGSACSCVVDSKKKENHPLRLSRVATIGDGFNDEYKRTGEKYESKGVLEAKKVPEMGSTVKKAGIAGLGKAVLVLDTLGSNLPNFISKKGILAGNKPRGEKVSILAFEVANTIAKAVSLMQSLSDENIQSLFSDVLQSEGVRLLVSSDVRELLRIAASDKRAELDVFAVEVARFGNMCKDPQWHNLSRYFQKLDSDTIPLEKLREEAQATMEQLKIMAQHTSELYHEVNALDGLEQELKQKLKDEETLPTFRRGESFKKLGSEVKSQRKLVKSLKKKSLWSMNIAEVVEQLVAVVTFLHKEISEVLSTTGNEGKSDNHPERLGIAGLALHYANIINQINSIASHPIFLRPNTRDALYNGLPQGVKSALRSRLQTAELEELTIPQIKNEMNKILWWIVPMAEDTIKAHQRFGWVGEWATMGTDMNKKQSQQQNVNRIQTLYHADKKKTEEWILQLIIWLHHLVGQVKNRSQGTRLPQSVLAMRAQANKGSKIAPDLQHSQLESGMQRQTSKQRASMVRSKSKSFTKNDSMSKSYYSSSGDFRTCVDLHCDSPGTAKTATLYPGVY